VQDDNYGPVTYLWKNEQSQGWRLYSIISLDNMSTLSKSGDRVFVLEPSLKPCEWQSSWW